MDQLYAIKEPVLILLLGAGVILCACQVAHLFLMSYRRESRPAVSVTLYEIFVVVHLLLMTNIVASALQHTGAFLIRIRPFVFEIEPLLWADVFMGLWGLGVALKRKKPSLVPSALVIGCINPLVIGLASSQCWLLIVADLAFFLLQIAINLTLDGYYRSRNVSYLSLIDAIDFLPEGILFATQQGNLLTMNDAMRSCLKALGFKADHIDTTTLWEQLRNKAQSEQEIIQSGQSDELKLPISSEEIRLFTKDVIVLRKTPVLRIAAIDITQEEQINARINEANKELEEANEQLRQSLESAIKAANEQAFLAMKARVHDIIGQRLSILHRYLEDGVTDVQSLQEITNLLSHVVDDLDVVQEPDNQMELESIVQVFQVINVSITLEGELPSDSRVAHAFVAIVREAATNAVKHGQASAITVTFSQPASLGESALGQAVLFEENSATKTVPTGYVRKENFAELDASVGYVLEVSNNGTVPSEAIVEGGGFANMGQQAESIHGIFSVRDSLPFTIVVEVLGAQ